MKREEIIKALAPLYRIARAENSSISASYMAEENDYKAQSIARVLNKSHGYVEGLESAAKALGISVLEIV